MPSQVFEQSIRIKASSVVTEECITDLKLMLSLAQSFG